MTEEFVNPFLAEEEEKPDTSVISFNLSDKDCFEKGWTVVNDPYKNQKKQHQKAQARSATFFREEPQNYRMDEEPTVIYYKHPYKFQTIMPDKSGCVYYPNDRLAILLSDTGMYQSFIVFHYDRNNPMQLANFDSNGQGYCNHINGKIRLQITKDFCTDFNENGDIVRKYKFPKDSRFYKFRPILFNLNEFIHIKVCNKSKIIFTFETILAGCQFKIKLNRLQRD